MSEHRLHDFRAVDRPLTEEERNELHAISTRAEITATRFRNEYNWGDLKVNPGRLVERYFDGYFFLANYGSRALMLRIPSGFVDEEVLEQYVADEAVHAWSHGPHEIFHFEIHDEGGRDEWWHVQDALDGLIVLREQLVSGDLRCLYLAWLREVRDRVHWGEDVESFRDVPIPPGLDILDGALQTFVDVFTVDPDLIAAAARYSEPLATWDTDRQRALRSFVEALPVGTKDELLVRVAERDHRVGHELLAQFRESANPRPTPKRPPPLQQLLDEAEQLRTEREHQERLRRERATRARAQAQAAARQQRLKLVAENWENHWSEVFDQIDERKREAYRRAAALMAELCEAADSPERHREADQNVRTVRDECASRSALMDEMDKAGLPPRV